MFMRQRRVLQMTSRNGVRSEFLISSDFDFRLANLLLSVGLHSGALMAKRILESWITRFGRKFTRLIWWSFSRLILWMRCTRRTRLWVSDFMTS